MPGLFAMTDRRKDQHGPLRAGTFHATQPADQDSMIDTLILYCRCGFETALWNMGVST
jgi:hypothetical protein